VPVEAQDRLRRPLVAPTALTVAGERGHVEQHPGEFEIDIAHPTQLLQAAVPSRIIISISRFCEENSRWRRLRDMLTWTGPAG
jgi:hypothetical protein